MQRRLCEMSEAKWSITEAKCLQISHNKYASQRDAISHSMGNLMLSHSAGMHNTDKSIAGISKRFHFASLHYIFSAYLPTHIKFLMEFHRTFFGTTCISFPNILSSGVFRRETASGFYPWGNVVSPPKRVAEGLCGWRHGNSFPMTQSAQSHRKCEAFHFAPRLFFMFLFLITFTILQQCIIYSQKFSNEPKKTVVLTSLTS